MKIPWRVFGPPTFEDPDDARVAGLVQIIALTTLVATAAMSVNNLLAGQSFAAVSMALAALVAAAVVLLLRLRQLRVAALLIPALGNSRRRSPVESSGGTHRDRGPPPSSAPFRIWRTRPCGEEVRLYARPEATAPTSRAPSSRASPPRRPPTTGS